MQLTVIQFRSIAATAFGIAIAVASAQPALAQISNGVAQNGQIIGQSVIKKKAADGTNPYANGPCTKPDAGAGAYSGGISLLGVVGQTMSGQAPVNFSNTHGIRGLREVPATQNIFDRHDANHAAEISIARKYPDLVTVDSYTDEQTKQVTEKVRWSNGFYTTPQDYQNGLDGWHEQTYSWFRDRVAGARNNLKEAKERGESGDYEQKVLAQLQTDFNNVMTHEADIRAKIFAYHNEMAPIWASEAALDKEANDLCK